MEVKNSRVPGDLLVRAALAGRFDPLRLVSHPGLDTRLPLRALAAVSMETQSGDAWFWTLTGDARRAGLAQLPPPGLERRALLAEADGLPPDENGQALLDLLAEKPDRPVARLLSGRNIKPRELETDRALRLFQAHGLLTAAGVVLPEWAADPGLARRLERLVTARRRKAAAEALLPDGFHGRTRELRALRDFARTGLVKSGAGSLVRPALGQGFAVTGGVASIAVSGVGGSGKSALIEALRRVLVRDSIAVVSFDFDRAALRTGDTTALTTEFIRQLADRRPDIDAALSVIRSEFRAELGRQIAGEGSSVEVSGKAVVEALSDLGELRAAEDPVAPMVILIDTFEEALVLGEARVRLIVDWLRLVRDLARCPGLRVVLSGRSTDTLARASEHGLALAGVIELGDLGIRAGRAKLVQAFRRLSIPCESLVPTLVATFGSNPLVIEILAQFSRNRSEAEIAALATGRDHTLRAGLDAEVRQCFLYTRIIERLDDPALRALASPGLVLRRITSRQIAEVLAAPCGLPTPMGQERAEALFEALAAEVWLVRQSAGRGGELEHLPDLRRVMLPQVLVDPTAEAVARAAAEWFETGAGSAEASAPLEALYYRALLDPDVLPVEPGSLRALADYLGTAVDDLPAAARARLREASGRVLSQVEIGLMGGEARFRAIRHRQSVQTSLGLESAVVSEFEEGLGAGLGPVFGPDLAADPHSTRPSQATWLPPPDVIRSKFAAGELEELAALALPAAIALLEDLLTGSGVWLDSDPLHHPAYACALASLSGTADAGFATGLHEWLSQPGHRAAVTEALAPAATTRGGGAAAAATMVLKIAGIDPEVPDPEGDAPVGDLVRWRVWLAGGVPAMRSPRVVLPVLPLFDPEILAAPGIAVDQRTSKNQIETVRHLRLRTEPTKLRDLTRTRGEAARMALRFGPGVVRSESLPRLLPGRRLELYPPLRGLLERQENISGLASAVERIETELPWWPLELHSDRLAVEAGITTRHALIDTVDLFGRLGQFVKDLADAPDPDPVLHRLDALMERFGTIWSSRIVPAVA